MRYPYERFLRYLLSRKADVPRAVERIGLPSLGEMWKPRAWRELCAAAPPQILKYLHSPPGRPVPQEGLIEWARALEMDLWWREQPELGGAPDPALGLAGRIFFVPATRAVVGMLLLADVGHDDLQAIVKERFRFEVDEAALAVYEHAYWKRDERSGEFWKDLLETFAPEERQLYAHGLHWPPLPLAELRQLLGLAPSDDDPEEALRESLMIARQGLREATRAPVPEHRSVFQWLAVVERAAVQVRKGLQLKRLKEGQTEPDPAQAFSLFSVPVDRTEIVTLADLQGTLPEAPDEKGRA